MNLIAKKLAVLSLSAVGLLGASQSFASVTYETPAGTTASGYSVDAEATFSLVGDVLTIQLSNLEANPSDVDQLISGVEFDVSGGTKATLDTSSGITATIGNGGSYAPSSSAASLSKWTLSGSSGSSINLSTLGSDSPYDMIIGPDSAGGYSGKGKYNKGNSSIKGEPVVLGDATFTVTVNGLNSLSQLSDVQFEFGCMPDCDTANGQKVNTPTPVPEPTTIISGLLILLPLSIQLLRKAREQKQPAPVKIIKQS